MSDVLTSPPNLAQKYLSARNGSDTNKHLNLNYRIGENFVKVEKPRRTLI